MAVEARSFERDRGARGAFWRLWLFRLTVALWVMFSGLALTAAQAQTACMYSVCNPWGNPPAYTAIGRTPISACTQGTARWIATSNVDVSLYGGYPKTEVCGGGSNCCINWPAGQQNYTWLCSGPCAPEITEENSCSTANPVQPGVGRKRLQETDYSGTSTHALQLTRFYSNNWTDGAASSGLSPIPAMDGGWRHNYQAAIKIRADGYIRAFRPDGRLLAFTADPGNANTWLANGGRETLLGLMDSAGQRSGYLLNAKGSDQVETYNAEGQLLSIKDRNGWLTTLTYSNTTTPPTSAPRPGLLLSVRNQFGRELKFVYDQAGRLAELIPLGASAGQPAGNADSPIRYRYNETSGLGVSTPAEDQLTSVVWQDGTIRRYHHEDDRWPRAVTGITAENNTRYSTYAYDSMGRVTRSELANGVERLDFSYGANGNAQPITTVTDYASGVPASRTYTFTDIKGSRYAQAVTAPCPTCGSTAQATQYDAEGRKTREVKHDGTVVFYAYDAAGRETERATFPLIYQSAGVRPALRFATSVTSTRWHTTWDLPTRITEPGRNTTYSYNARGITATSTSATTDATGAAKFGATLTGPVATTQYAYNANSLNTSITELTDGVQTQRWTLAYSASGDLISITDATGGNQSATLTNDAQGRLTRISASNGAVASYTWNVHGQLAVAAMPGFTATLTYDSRKLLTDVRLSTGQWLRVTYSASGEPVSVLDASGQVQQISGLSTHWLRSDSPIKAAQALLSHSLQHGTQRLGDALVPSAIAQPLPLPIPAGIAAGLAAGGAGSAASRGDSGPASGACCGGTGQVSTRDMQERLQRTLPFTLMTTAAEAIEVLTSDILTMRAGAQLRKRMQCPTEAFYQPLPPGCFEAHHIVAVGKANAKPARDVLAQVGIDINSPANGVWMQCGKHRRMHTNAYYSEVNARITGAPQTRGDIEMALAKIRAELKAGVFP